MKLTKGDFFVDSNVLLYLLSDDERKKAIAKNMLVSNPIISTQVISENINVLFKKFKELSPAQIEEHSRILANYCFVRLVTTETISTALQLKVKYRLQWFDSLILSSALINECQIIYSEDLQHGQIIEGKLKVMNPFL